MIKKLLLAAAVLALFAGCDPKEPEVPELDVTGVWELTSVGTKVPVGSVDVSVYLNFDAEGSFSLYQKIGSGRYTFFQGTWSLDKEAALLTGKYSDGKVWGPYETTCENGVLTLSASGETDSYKKIDAIPDSVTSNVY